MRFLLFAFIAIMGFTCTVAADDVEAFKARERALENLTHISRSDLSFFFDAISFSAHGWVFKLSPNVRGLNWRIRRDESDVTGACESGQVLNVLPGGSLEVEQKGLDLVFMPRDGRSFQVRLILDTKIENSLDHEEREGILVAHDRGYSLVFVGE